MRSILSALFLFFSTVAVPTAYSAPLLALQAGTFDPLGPPAWQVLDWWEHRALPPSEGKALAVIQFQEARFAEQKAFMNRNGLIWVQYLPEQAWLTVLSPSELRSWQQTSGVRWAGWYRPEWKLAACFLEGNISLPNGKLAVALTPGSVSSEVTLAIERSGTLLFTGQTGPYPILHVALQGQDWRPLVQALAENPAVAWIEPLFPNLPHNDDAAWVTQSGLYEGRTTPIYDHGINGKGQVVGVLDSGADADMCFFYDPEQGLPTDTVNTGQRKIIAYQEIWGFLNWDGDSHGTHTACTVAGDKLDHPGERDHGDGQAPGAKLVIQDVSNPLISFLIPPTLTPVFDYAYSGGARLHSNSWGANTNAYNIQEFEVDTFTWEHPDFLPLYSAGNEGPGAGTVGSPSGAKNDVSVGATVNGSGAEDMASFSSHGPTADGRIKPDVTAPGVAVDSARNDYDAGLFNCDTVRYSGTSMSCPTVAGCAALVRQYYEDGFYPTGTAHRRDRWLPSAALVKATLIASTDPMNGKYTADEGEGIAPPPSLGQGWGRVHLDNALAFSGQNRRLFIEDDKRGLDDSKVTSFTVTVADPLESLKVVLTWTDPPPALGAVKALVNNLNLIVAKDGHQWFGNVFERGFSKEGGIVDATNNVEVVWLNRPQPGVYTISVDAAAVPQGPQPFALAATGAFVRKEGLLSLFPENVSCNKDLSLVVADEDLMGQGSLPIRVTSTSDPTGFDLSLTETPAGTGVFQGTLQRTSSPAPGKLLAPDGDTIKAVYVDAQPGTGTGAQTLTATAAVDCTAPKVSQIRVISITPESAIVTWRTDEPATSYAGFDDRAGQTLRGVASTVGLSLAHAVTLSSLKPDSTYFFEIRTGDPASNVTRANKDGAYYTFKTQQTQSLFADDFEEDRGWVASGNPEWQWHFPQGFGAGIFRNPDPNADHTSGLGRVWGTDLIEDGLYGSDSEALLTSPPIDCTTGSNIALFFWRWLNVGGFGEQGSAVAAVEMQSEPGGPWQVLFQTTSNEETEWVRRGYTLSPGADGKPAVRVRFRLSTTGATAPKSGWNLDDVLVTARFGATGTPYLDRSSTLLVAGFQDTSLTTTQGGTLKVLALAPAPFDPASGSLMLRYQGLPLLEVPLESAADGLFLLPGVTVGAGGRGGLYLLDLGFEASPGAWPYLTVNDGL